MARLKIGTKHEEPDSKVFYEFSDLRILRATKKGRQSLRTKKLWTAANSAMCGIEFEEDETYLITGDVDTKNASTVNLCNYSAFWDGLTKEEMKGFSGDYGTNC